REPNEKAGPARRRPGRPVQPRRPSLLCPSSQSDRLPVLFFLALRFGAAAGGGAAAASLARRSALSRAVLARSATASASYSDVAFLASLARCNFANCTLAACLSDFSAISPSFSMNR